MKEIECPNCGAVFEAKEPKCPYCGHINPMGAEAKFLRDLEKTVFNYDYKGNYADELAWQHERFIEYDIMLDGGEYEKLMEAIATDGEKHDVWSWERYDEFMEIADELWGDPMKDAEDESE